MGKVVLVTGGARSGKSSFAESIYMDNLDVTYIATSIVYDNEMKDRVELHKNSRPREWKTFEGQISLSGAVNRNKDYLLDCLTVFTSNIMFEITRDYERIPYEIQKQVEDKVVLEIESLINEVKKIDGSLVMVTNEVGYSIVPESHVGRVFRDIAGKVNQRVAKLCNEVYLVVCGIPMRVK